MKMCPKLPKARAKAASTRSSVAAAAAPSLKLPYLNPWRPKTREAM